MDSEGKSERGSKRHKEPRGEKHLSKFDRVVWRALTRAIDMTGIEVVWDVQVGEETDEIPGASKGYQRLWAGLRRKRIDAVLRTEGVDYVVEIKPRAGMVALGQVVTYRDLWKRQAGSNRPAIAIIACGEVDRDVSESLVACGVTVWLAPLTQAERLEVGLPVGPPPTQNQG